MCAAIKTRRYNQHMINRKHRFHGHNALRYVYQHGQTTRGSLLSIKSTINERQPSYRLAVVVSKKVSKSAVVRNRIRRRIYEIVRQHEGQISQPYDLVISVFHEKIKDMPAPELTKLVTTQLKQAKII
jgi:ribonuclease P protein component